MGLSSSQGRLLMLTSRLSDIQYQETLLSQRQAKLAFESEKAASDYNTKMNNYKLEIKMPDKGSDSGYKTEDLDYEKMTQLGYVVMDSNEQIYLQKDENGEWIIPKDLDGKDILSIDSSTGKAVIGDKEFNIVDGKEHLSKPKDLQNAIMKGVLFILDTSDTDAKLTLDNLKSETKMEYVLDKSDDVEAQTTYDMETTRIGRKDNQIDIEIKQLETQHNVVAKEIDSVKEVLNSNVERTFKLFSNG